MFSFQASDELVFGAPTTLPQEYQTPHHQHKDLFLSEGNLISFSADGASKEKQLIQSTNLGSPRPRKRLVQTKYGWYDQRRVMHREIERKRREEASNLHASLRSLLPMDHNKGKTSVSDQLEEATSYIKEMHERVQELRGRRDKLKRLQNSSSSSSCGTNVEGKLHKCVSLEQVQDGMEILISSESPEFELSEVLTLLSEREIDVASCVSTRTKAGFLHKVDIKGNDDMKGQLDVKGLHDILKDAINCKGYCSK